MPAKGQINKSIRDANGNLIPWKKRNRLQSNTTTREYRSCNPQKVRAENKKYRESQNPFSAAVAVANRRAQILGVSSTLTTIEWRSVAEENKFICHLCGTRVSLELGSPERLSLDHVVPMSRGGQNVKENVLPSHRRCNQSRLNMTLEEFDQWLVIVSNFRRSEYGRSEESIALSRPSPSLTKVGCTGL